LSDRAPLLAPGAVAVAYVSLQMAGGTLSRDRTATGLAFLLVGLALHVASGSLLERRHARRRFQGIVVGSTFLLALVSIGQRAAGSERIFGVFERPLETPFAGPFWYRNHFAALLVLLTPLALSRLAGVVRATRRGGQRPLDGLGLAPRDSARLLEWLAVSITIVLALLTTGSRGGILALLAGLFFSAALHRSKSLLYPGVALLCLAPLTAGAALERLRDLPRDGRLVSWHANVELARQHAPWGAGLNTYSVALGGAPELRRTMAETHPHLLLAPHSDPLQVLIETGWPGLLLTVWAMTRVVRSTLGNPWTTAGVCGFLLHATVDFLVSIPALALAFAAISAWPGRRDAAAR
jgi:hypothetical protein